MKKFDCKTFRQIWLNTEDQDEKDLERATAHLEICPVCRALELEQETRFLLKDYDSPGEGEEYFNNLCKNTLINPDKLTEVANRAKEQIRTNLNQRLAKQTTGNSESWITKRRVSLRKFFQEIQTQKLPATFEPVFSSIRQMRSRLPIFEVNISEHTRTTLNGLNSDTIKTPESDNVLLELSEYVPALIDNPAMLLILSEDYVKSFFGVSEPVTVSTLGEIEAGFQELFENFLLKKNPYRVFTL